MRCKGSRAREQRFRYEKDSLSKKEERSWGDNAVVGHPVDGNSGKNAKQNHNALR